MDEGEDEEEAVEPLIKVRRQRMQRKKKGRKRKQKLHITRTEPFGEVVVQMYFVLHAVQSVQPLSLPLEPSRRINQINSSVTV